MWLAGGYSTVCLEPHNGYLSANQYHRGDYVFANAFYNVTSNFTVALEYLYGSRRDMGGSQNEANRLSLMAQYSF